MKHLNFVFPDCVKKQELEFIKVLTDLQISKGKLTGVVNGRSSIPYLSLMCQYLRIWCGCINYFVHM